MDVAAGESVGRLFSQIGTGNTAFESTIGGVSASCGAEGSAYQVEIAVYH